MSKMIEKEDGQAVKAENEPLKDDFIVAFRLEVFPDVADIMRDFTVEELGLYPDVYAGFYHVTLGKVSCRESELAEVAAWIEEQMKECFDKAMTATYYHEESRVVETKKPFWVLPVHFSQGDASRIDNFSNRLTECKNFVYKRDRIDKLHMTIGKYTSKSRGNYHNRESIRRFNDRMSRDRRRGTFNMCNLEFVRRGEERYETLLGINIRQRLSSVTLPRSNDDAKANKKVEDSISSLQEGMGSMNLKDGVKSDGGKKEVVKDSSRPWRRGGGGGGAGKSTQRVCRFYGTSQGCNFGAECRNLHIDKEK